MTRLFHRGRDLPTAVSGEGCWITDAAGRSYLDAAGGALVASIGHGDEGVAGALAGQASRIAYVHASAFTTAPVEELAERLARLLPMDDPRVFPVSGGSEAMETALKAVRAYHLARGEPDRVIVISRELSYHGNTRGALAVSGRRSLRDPYLPWLTHSEKVPGVIEYRCPNPAHPEACATWHAERLEEAILQIGPERVAAFVAEPIGGAASGAAEPPSGYWEEVVAVCRRHGVLIVADEVMTGVGRTGAWFASQHYGLRPDLVTMAKGLAGGYWPLGACALSGQVARTIEGAFPHGFTFSHHAVGAAVALEVLRRIEEQGLVEAAARRGARLLAGLTEALADHPHVGDVRGRGLLVAIELVEDRETKRPFSRDRRIAESVTAAAKKEGLLVYPSSGCADGLNGDLLMYGPPLVITEEEVDTVVERTRLALGGLA
ncbi:MAG: aspartate aminotransferase family protein [Acidimicrobiia bacterium]|nr:MAG: aspartate aminotransferase family protein [Acidimicrobiia bacterium]